MVLFITYTLKLQTINMKQIQPIKIWQSGTFIEANYLSAMVASDNLKDAASFQYTLFAGQDNPSISVLNGGLAMGGEEYQDWNANPDINNAAYEWIAGKLNLTIIGDYIAPIPEVIEETTEETTEETIEENQ